MRSIPCDNEESRDLVDEAALDFPSSSIDHDYDSSKYKKSQINKLAKRRIMFSVFIVALSSIAFSFFFIGTETEIEVSSDPMLLAKSSTLGSRKLGITSWNIAAINNNPFEYWITYDEKPEYEELMQKVEDYLENPRKRDIKVKHIFTEQMFEELAAEFEVVGWDDVRQFWTNDFKNRRVVSEFMKDPMLGSKRLISMPDRITNTINVAGSDVPACRPTVINMYGSDLSSNDIWWHNWKKFMFHEDLSINIGAEKRLLFPYQMLQPIKRSKYPDITEEEEEISLPLQTLCAAIFDAILVHMMNTLSNPDIWQPLKRTMVENLNKMKIPHTLDILDNVYGNSDIITLQEVSSSFIESARQGSLSNRFWILSPTNMAVRDQNSVIMLSKELFLEKDTIEITQLVIDSFPEGVNVPVAPGDINAVTATDKYGVKYVIVSFHGDTNGLATIPVKNAVVHTMKYSEILRNHTLIFGLDANTYQNATPGKQQDVMDWGRSYVINSLTSCWGDVPQQRNYTTFNARTYLQPQLNKACKSSEKREKGDVNPKDFIIFPKKDFSVVQTWKDNTGNRTYIEDMAFPTLNFPSDHGILATIIEFTE